MKIEQNQPFLSGISVSAVQKKEKADVAVPPKKSPSLDVYEPFRAESAQAAAADGQTDARDPSGLPLDFIFPEEELPYGNTTDMGNQISEITKQYFTGQVSKQDVKDTMTDIVDRLYRSYTELGFRESDFMPKLVEDVYDRMRLHVVNAAGYASWLEGKQYAETYNGHMENTRDWIYYDSQFYYSCEDMKQTIQAHAQELSESYGYPNPDLPTTYRVGDPRKGLYETYNSYINDHARNAAMIGNMLDESVAPSHDFRFFYKGNDSGSNRYSDTLVIQDTNDIDSIFDGVLHVWNGDWSFAGRVPVRFDATQHPVSLNMFDVVYQQTQGEIPEAIQSFLKNFDFYTMVQCGRYQKAHPRVY